MSSTVILSCGVECSICGHHWPFREVVETVEHDGVVSPVTPDKVECPRCGGMWGDLDV